MPESLVSSPLLMPRGTACVVYTGCLRRSMDKDHYEDYLRRNGWRVTQKPANADLIIYDTCGVTNTRSAEVMQQFKDLRRQLKADCNIVVGGCLAKTDPDQIRMVHTGPVFGPREKHKLDSFISSAIPLHDVAYPFMAQGGNATWDPQIDFFENFTDGTIRLATGQGCLNKCTFCAIRFATGPLQSISAEALKSQLETGISSGLKKACLLGEDVAAWGKDIGSDISYLLESLLEVPGNVDLGLFDMNPRWLIKSFERLKRSFADRRIREILIPYQSGSDRILKRMARHHKASALAKVLDELRTMAPTVKLGAVVIVGFPGESRQDAIQTAEMLSYFDYAQINAYSPVSGTVAAGMIDFENVPSQEVEERAQRCAEHVKNSRFFK